MGAIIMDFGKQNDGLNLYRINGSKEEINKAIEQLKNLGCELWNEPFTFEKSHKSLSVLIKLQIPERVPEEAETCQKE